MTALEDFFDEPEGINPRDVGYVYFIEEEGTDSFKVGCTNNVQARLASLQSGNPRKLRIVQEIHCDMRAEKLFHKFLSDHKIVREWYSDNELFFWWEEEESIYRDNFDRLDAPLTCSEIEFILAFCDMPYVCKLPDRVTL